MEAGLVRRVVHPTDGDRGSRHRRANQAARSRRYHPRYRDRRRARIRGRRVRDAVGRHHPVGVGTARGHRGVHVARRVRAQHDPQQERSAVHRPLQPVTGLVRRIVRPRDRHPGIARHRHQRARRLRSRQRNHNCRGHRRERSSHRVAGRHPVAVDHTFDDRTVPITSDVRSHRRHPFERASTCRTFHQKGGLVRRRIDPGQPHRSARQNSTETRRRGRNRRHCGNVHHQFS